MLKEFKRALGTQQKYPINFETQSAEAENEDSEMICYIFDTNIFIDEPDILSKLKNNEVACLPFTVVDELVEQSRWRQDIELPVKRAISNIQSSSSVIKYKNSEIDILPSDFSDDTNDNRILSIAYQALKDGEPAILVSSDKNLLWKAKTLGITALSLIDFDIAQIRQKSNNQTIYISPIEASSFLLGYLRDEAYKVIGEPVTKAVITVPATFNQTQIESVKNAGLDAGFDEVRIQKEPIAVGVAYGIANKDSNSTMLVYDFGGGTFDVSILELKNNNVKIIASDGDSKLGGVDITNKVVEYIYEEILNDNLDLDMFSPDSMNEEIFNECERAKKELSDANDSEINLAGLMLPNGEAYSFNIKLTRHKFDNLFSDIRRKATTVINRILSNNNLTVNNIDEIILAGGTSNIPAVKKSVNDLFNKQPISNIDTSTVISVGAVIEAMSEWGNDQLINIKPTYNDRALHDFGVSLQNYKFDVLIPADSELPIRETREYTTLRDNQDVVDIMVFNRTKNSKAINTYDSGISSVDVIKIEGLPPHQKGELQIQVTFELTREDILEVDVKVFDSRSSKQINSRNLTAKKASSNV